MKNILSKFNEIRKRINNRNMRLYSYAFGAGFALICLGHLEQGKWINALVAGILSAVGIYAGNYYSKFLDK